MQGVGQNMALCALPATKTSDFIIASAGCCFCASFLSPFVLFLLLFCMFFVIVFSFVIFLMFFVGVSSFQTYNDVCHL